MKARERLVKYFDLKLSAYAVDREVGAVDLPVRPFVDLLVEIKEFIAANACHRQNRARTETWHIADIVISDNDTKATILVSRSDRLAADQAISDPDAQVFNVTAKVGNQGNATSAHVVVNLIPTQGSTYLTIIEDTTGISSSDIAMLLSIVVKACGKANREFFMCNDASGDPALRKYSRYKFTFRGHPSQGFQDELNGGVLRGIELVDFEAAAQQFDGIPATVQKKKVTHLTVKNAPGTLFDTIRSIGQSARRMNLESIRVIFEDTSNFTRTVELDAQTLTLMNEDRFVHKVRLHDFAQKLDTGYQLIHPEMSARMLALL